MCVSGPFVLCGLGYAVSLWIRAWLVSFTAPRFFFRSVSSPLLDVVGEREFGIYLATTPDTFFLTFFDLLGESCTGSGNVPQIMRYMGGVVWIACAAYCI